MRTTTTFRQFLTEGCDHTIQLELPDALAEKILVWGDDNIPEGIVFTTPEDVSFGREDEPHITVLYRLCDDEPRPVEKLLSQEKPGKVKLGKMSLFTINDNFDVLKIDVASESLHRFNKMLLNDVEAKKQYLHYVPHVTIAYLKKGKGDQFIGDGTFEGESFTFDELHFSSRQGHKTKIRIGVS